MVQLQPQRLRDEHSQVGLVRVKKHKVGGLGGVTHEDTPLSQLAEG
jgi:hypothetical protein